MTGRVTRNIVFWLLMALYMNNGRSFLHPYFFAVLFTMLVSYGIPGYLHNLWLIPRFLVKRKTIQYVLLFLLLLTSTTVLSFYLTHFVNSRLVGLNYMGALKDVTMPYHAFPGLLMFALLAFGKFMADAVKNQHRLDNMEMEQLQSELSSLRSQINPHFLFNALNTIYGMARRTDEDTADAILKLSDILRHGLYECEDTEIYIEKEIMFVKQYVEFAQLRLYDKDKIKLTIDAATTHQKIAPLLLIPFIENAIKHGLGRDSGNSWVKVALSLHDNNLLFVCVNSNFSRYHTNESLSVNSGIGLKNVKRRLDLLYADKHTLDIQDGITSFSVTLNLQLT